MRDQTQSLQANPAAGFDAASSVETEPFFAAKIGPWMNDDAKAEAASTAPTGKRTLPETDSHTFPMTTSSAETKSPTESLVADELAVPALEQSQNIVREWRKKRRAELRLPIQHDKSLYAAMESGEINMDPIWMELMGTLIENGVSLSVLADESQRMLELVHAANMSENKHAFEVTEQLRTATRELRVATTVLHESTRFATEEGMKKMAGTVGRLVAKHGDAVEEILKQFAEFNERANEEQKKRLQLSKEVYDHEERQMQEMRARVSAVVADFDAKLKALEAVRADIQAATAKRSGGSGVVGVVVGVCVGAALTYIMLKFGVLR